MIKESTVRTTCTSFC